MPWLVDKSHRLRSSIIFQSLSAPLLLAKFLMLLERVASAAAVREGAGSDVAATSVAQVRAASGVPLKARCLVTLLLSNVYSSFVVFLSVPRQCYVTLMLISSCKTFK